MTKKKKILLFSIIGVLVIATTIIVCCFLFIKPSILGKWTLKNGNNKIIMEFEENNKMKMTSEYISSLKEGSTDIKSVKLYYKIENDILYYNDKYNFSDDSTVKLYIIKLTSSELIVSNDANGTFKQSFSKV